MPIVTVKNNKTGVKSEVILPKLNSPPPAGFTRVFVPSNFSIGNTFSHLKQTPFKENIRRMAYKIEEQGGKWPAANSKQAVKKVWDL